MAAFCVCMRWPDRDLVADFIRGFPIVGELPTSGVLRFGGKDAEGSIPEFQHLAAARAIRATDVTHEPEDQDFIRTAVEKLMAAQPVASEVKLGLLDCGATLPSGKSTLERFKLQAPSDGGPCRTRAYISISDGRTLLGVGSTRPLSHKVLFVAPSSTGPAY